MNRLEGEAMLALEGLCRSVERLRSMVEDDMPPCLAISELDLIERRIATLRTTPHLTVGGGPMLDTIDAIISDNIYVDNDGVAGISAAAEAIVAALRAAPQPVVNPLGSGMREACALIQELFNYTTPVNDAGKFSQLAGYMAESGWWKRASAILSLPEGEGCQAIDPLHSTSEGK